MNKQAAPANTAVPYVHPAADPNDPRPFGAQRTRPRGPLMFWSILYVSFLLFLIVMVLRFTNLR